MTNNQIYAQIKNFNDNIRDSKETRANKYYYMQDEEASERASFLNLIRKNDLELDSRLHSLSTVIDLAFGSANLSIRLILDNNIKVANLTLNDKFLVDANNDIITVLENNNLILNCTTSDLDFFDSSKFSGSAGLIIFNPTSGGKPHFKDYNKNGNKEDLIKTIEKVTSNESIICFNGKPEEFKQLFSNLNCVHHYSPSKGSDFLIAYKSNSKNIEALYQYSDGKIIKTSSVKSEDETSVDLNKLENNIKNFIQNLKTFDTEQSAISEELLPIDEKIKNFTDFLEKLPESKKSGLLEAIANHHLTNDDINILLGRKKSLEIFSKELEKSEWNEPNWQAFFEENPWIFGYGLNYQYLKILQREAHVSGVGLDGKNEVISDFLMGNKFTVLVELKRPDTNLFGSKIERSETWKLSAELHSAVSQILAQKAEWQIKSEKKNYDLEGKPITQETFDPKTILIIGTTKQFLGTNQEDIIKAKTFELFRRNSRNIEILTYDELFERAEFIVNQTNYQ